MNAGRGTGQVGRGSIIVIDIGKTLSKVTLWNGDGRLLDRQVRPNQPCVVDGLRRLDAAGIAAWLLDTLARYRDRGVATIIPVGHGASVVALAADGPACAPLDYEQPIPADILAAYRAARDPFAQTGSPALPDGLNLGAQLFWLDRLYPETRGATLLPWAQYWAWLLTGRAVSEVTSLGCHSDLWNPGEGRFSALARREGWASRFAPLVRAGDVVGTLSPAIAARTGLSEAVEVLAGLHDSNAALLAARGFDEIARKEATILSTGTWFIAMRMPDAAVFTGALSEARDCLVNVDAYGRPVPSARFMGGREIETVIGIDTRRVDIRPDQPALLAAVPNLLEHGAMLLPTLAPGCGPFPASRGEWVHPPEDWIERRAAACLYAALVADVSLDLIGSRDRLLVEGRFAEAEVFVRALASLRPDTEVMVANAHNDVSFGALRLVDPTLKPQGALRRVEPLPHDLGAYRAAWRMAAGEPA
ncbi:MAG: carbohydrate kinase [Sphingomonadales bacterium]|nr:carbohydrate kinase [Sphingomonadales bacterium]